jgi:hypothetical protein
LKQNIGSLKTIAKTWDKVFFKARTWCIPCLPKLFSLAQYPLSKDWEGDPQIEINFSNSVLQLILT